MDAICEIGGKRTYKAGVTAADIGDPIDTFVYVLEGEIEVVDPYTDERLLESALGQACASGGAFKQPCRFDVELSFQSP